MTTNLILIPAHEIASDFSRKKAKCSNRFCQFNDFFSLMTSAIQELQSNITQLMKQRDEAQLLANEKDRQLSELRREVNNVIDKKKRLEHELERLKQHLVQVEEGYTNEALASEERERELRKKLQVNKEQTISGR